MAGTLPSGKGLRLFVKVFAPSSAAAGETDNRTLQAIVKNSTGAGACASPEPAAQSVVDTSNVMTAQIRLLKEQGLMRSATASSTWLSAPPRSRSSPASA